MPGPEEQARAQAVGMEVDETGAESTTTSENEVQRQIEALENQASRQPNRRQRCTPALRG